jgi:hypothetical protein
VSTWEVQLARDCERGFGAIKRSGGKPLQARLPSTKTSHYVKLGYAMRCMRIIAEYPQFQADLFAEGPDLC